ncbi:MAG: UDP-N-acetylmuramyl-tripeptide synthetase [Spirochaetia bacterium]|nr:UDP-N-acetylmuramyl-tripeptide synthetase [Spirochaetia bacterium]NCC89635.1 UDP-N-acetylmuramyl-tripeptide synthetase [Spirochaetia bacterium]
MRAKPPVLSPIGRTFLLFSPHLCWYHKRMNTLRSLLEAVGIFDTRVPHDLSIASICQHSQDCRPNSVFFAFSGLHTNGLLFVREAVKRGAVCVISEKPITSDPESQGFYAYTVEQAHTCFALMCAALHDNPQEKLSVIGISGTDGKSTTCDYLYQMLKANEVKVGVLTTVSMDDGSGKVDSPYRQSTPEPDQLQAFLARCVDNQVSHVILECTSHALSKQYDRLAGISFAAAIITKVTSEHLEFHHSLEEYTNAKVNLVKALQEGGLLLTSTDNSRYETFIEALCDSCSAIVLGKDIPMRIEFMGYQGVVVEIYGQHLPTPLLLPSLATNALLAAFTASHLLNKEPKSLLQLIPRLQPVKGRMHLIENKLGVRVIIDFAHTADAYEGVFSFAKRTCEGGDIIAVFGCAGERDSTKRPAMGKIANKYSSVIILTEEDPRKEGNQAIFSDLRYLMHNPLCTVWEIEDRRMAIRKALSIALGGDTLLFLGKGHEKSIERADGKIAWDEIAEVQAALQEEEQRRGCK